MLISNPNDKAHGTNAPPHHIKGNDAIELYNWVQQGGGLILMGNQENHNLETKDVNQFLRLIGLKWTDHYTDAKRLERGYYEDLADVGRFGDTLASLYARQPKDWRGTEPTTRETGAAP